VTVEYVLRGWEWVAHIEPTIGYMLLWKLAFLNIILSGHINFIMDCVACIDKTPTELVSLPPRY